VKWQALSLRQVAAEPGISPLWSWIDLHTKSNQLELSQLGVAAITLSPHQCRQTPVRDP